MKKLRSLAVATGKLSLRILRGVDREFNDLPSQWIRTPQEDRPMVIFVHGILGKSSRVWGSKKKPGWPELLANDSRFNGWGIVLANWYSTIFSTETGIAQESERLYQELSTMSGPSSPLQKEHIVFVCHSMGGIIARQILTSHPELLDRSRITIVTLSTPAKGSAAANLVASLATATGHTQALELLPDNTQLTKLDQDFRTLIARFPDRISGIELVETHLVGKRNAALAKLYTLTDGPTPIVTQDSQGNYFGLAQAIDGTDHRSISRPESRMSPQYMIAAEVMLRDESE
jgi:pimeloyl-ACP methyl ester carboxylesterase